jgi:hypothetical protein
MGFGGLRRIRQCNRCKKQTGDKIAGAPKPHAW